MQFVTIVEPEFNILISAMMKNPDYILKQHIKLFDQLKYKHIGTVQWDLYELSRDTQCGIPISHFMHDS